MEGQDGMNGSRDGSAARCSYFCREKGVSVGAGQDGIRARLLDGLDQAAGKCWCRPCLLTGRSTGRKTIIIVSGRRSEIAGARNFELESDDW